MFFLKDLLFVISSQIFKPSYGPVCNFSDTCLHVSPIEQSHLTIICELWELNTEALLV